MLTKQEGTRNLQLTGQGSLLLCIGMALFAAGSIMANPAFEESGYTTAAILTALCLLAFAVDYAMLLTGERARGLFKINVLAAAIAISSWLIFWIIESAPLELRLLNLLAGSQNVLLSLYYMRLAFHLKAQKRKAILLCTLAATATFLGILLATQFQLSRLSAVTEVALNNIFVGAQALLTSVYLYRACRIEQESPSQRNTKAGNVGTVEDSQMLASK